MGFGGISIWQLVIVLGIIILLFGTKKLRNLGGDVGSAVKGFKKAMSDEDKPADKKDADFEPKNIEQQKKEASAETTAETKKDKEQA